VGIYIPVTPTIKLKSTFIVGFYFMFVTIGIGALVFYFFIKFIEFYACLD